MREVVLYDSRGYRLGDQGGKQNETVWTVSRYDIDFVVSFGREWSFTVYFRAYESSSSRLDQYYAVSHVPENEVNFSEFRDAVFRRAEEHGLEIEESGAGGNILQTLEETGLPTVGRRDERQRAERLLGQGNQLRFGVSSYGAALRLMSELDGARRGMSFAVTDGDGAELESLDAYDLVVEKGSYAGLTPLGATAELMDPTPTQPETQARAQSQETWRDHPAADAAVAVVAGVGAVALIVALYAVVVHVAWGGAFGVVGGGTALPMAAEVPGVNNVTVSGAEPGASRNFTVTGSTPASALTFQYYNDTEGESRTEQRVVPTAGPGGTFTLEGSLRENETRVTVVRSSHAFPLLDLPVVGPPLGSWSPNGAAASGETTPSNSTRATPAGNASADTSGSVGSSRL
jgi:hypothetical protein